MGHEGRLASEEFRARTRLGATRASHIIERAALLASVHRRGTAPLAAANGRPPTCVARGLQGKSVMNKRLSPDELKAERCGADTSLSSKTLARRLTDDRPPTPGTPLRGASCLTEPPATLRPSRARRSARTSSWPSSGATRGPSHHCPRERSRPTDRPHRRADPARRPAQGTDRYQRTGRGDRWRAAARSAHPRVWSGWMWQDAARDGVLGSWHHRVR
jgi:hypothetical protein